MLSETSAVVKTQPLSIKEYRYLDCKHLNMRKDGRKKSQHNSITKNK